MIVLDTNVVSALMSDNAGRLQPWLNSVVGSSLFTTAITRAEIRYGLERMPQGVRRRDLLERADLLFDEVSDRLLAFDAAAADRYGVVVAARESKGRPISVPDAQIASIAFVHRAVVATRNVRDFEDCGVKVVDPFAVDARS